MSNSTDQVPSQPVGSPQLQVIIPDKLGGQKVEEVQVDSNRLSPISEQRLLWLDALAIPARTEDILIEAAVWMAGSAFSISILKTLPDSIPLLVPVLAFLGLSIVVSCYAWNQFKQLRIFIVYRALLLAIGLCMGVLL